MALTGTEQLGSRVGEQRLCNLTGHEEHQLTRRGQLRGGGGRAARVLQAGAICTPEAAARSKSPTTPPCSQGRASACRAFGPCAQGGAATCRRHAVMQPCTALRLPWKCSWKSPRS